MQIEGKELSVESQFDPVTYVPNHVNGNAKHQDCEQGVIIGWNDSTVKVLYCKGRTIQSTNPKDLVWG